MDQKFIFGRNIFENISRLVDEIFDDYIRRQGFAEPLSAKFCNGTTTTCDGLSQWGSQSLAQEGMDSLSILRQYYGDDIELVVNAPVQDLRSSYPGTPLRQGSSGPEVEVIQAELNRISQNYPAIPKITPVDGIFGSQTEQSVRRFQEIFGLTPDGIVGKVTWYKLVFLYVGVLNLSELVSQGQRIFGLAATQYPSSGTPTREEIMVLQYFLSVYAQFDPSVPAPTVDGIFGPGTERSVQAFQRVQGLPSTGQVDPATWNALYNAYEGIDTTVLAQEILFPAELQGLENAPEVFENSSRLTQYPGRELSLGDQDKEGGRR